MHFSKRLHLGQRTKSFLIHQHPHHGGWEVREEDNSEVVRSRAYADWHRVERARIMFELEASTLAREGWTEA